VTSQEIAAFLAETIPVSGGMIVPPAEWLPRLRALTERWDALLVLDEAQLAPAKTGRMWAFEHWGVVPDIVTFGKAMTAGMGIAGTVTTQEIAAKARGKAGVPWAGTYSGDPLPAAVALKQLEIVIRDRLSERAAKLGEFQERRLGELRDAHEVVGDVRGMGLYHVLDIVADKESRTPDPAMAERIRYNALLEGLMMIAVKNCVRVCPPLIITEAELDDALERLETAVRRSMEGYPKDVDFSTSSSLAATRPRAEKAV
jgi:2,2-dialkylglycine decarboxylase (pyruvate)